MHSILDELGLGGMVHIWGRSGTGKTHLAIAIASEVARDSHVLWVNTDGKASFIHRLRANMEAVGGARENVSVVLGHGNGVTEVGRIGSIMKQDTKLVVVDTVTRVLDMARRDPIMWGRELVEEALPTLAGIGNYRNCTVVVLSEVRYSKQSTKPALSVLGELPDNGDSDNEDSVRAVYHNEIRKYCDHDLILRHEGSRRLSTILRVGEDSESEIAEMIIDDVGVVEVRAIQNNDTGRDLESSESHVSA